MQIATPTINALTQLQQAIDRLITVGGVLLPVARTWGYLFGVLSFLVVCGKGLVYVVRQQSELVLVDLIVWLTKLLTVAFMLRYYVTPIPGFGVAFPDLFTTIGRQFAGTISVATLDTLLGQINACAQGLQHPPAWNFFALIVYFTVLLAMSALDGTLLLITALGFFAVGLGKVFGSILITFLLLPGWDQKFWNWINFMFIYSMYRAVAAATVYVAATFFVNFFQTSVQGNYSLGLFTSLFVFMIASIVAILVLAFKAPHFTVELFGGGLGHAGSEFGSSIRSVLLILARP